jgi:hypothetical protein
MMIILQFAQKAGARQRARQLITRKAWRLNPNGMVNAAVTKAGDCKRGNQRVCAHG